MTSPVSAKRVRFSPDVKDSDDVSSSSSRSNSPVIPRTPKRPIYGSWQLPSPPLSDASSGENGNDYYRRERPSYQDVDPIVLPDDIDLLVHSLLLPPPTAQRVVYDARTHPMQAFIHSMPPFPLAPHYNTPATQPALTRIQLVSRYLPWTITVENPSGVTIGDILYRVFSSLNKTVAKSEYETVDERNQARILQAYKRNCTPNPNLPPRTREEGLKRIDWLADRTMFGGIQKDMSYINARVTDVNMRSETFVLEFAALP